MRVSSAVFAHVGGFCEIRAPGLPVVPLGRVTILSCKFKIQRHPHLLEQRVFLFQNFVLLCAVAYVALDDNLVHCYLHGGDDAVHIGEKDLRDLSL
mgnify:CR=1 FL=1